MNVEVTVNPTETSPVTPSRSLGITPVNFGADWRVVAEKPGEVVLVNIKDPVVGAAQLRCAYSLVDDVFKGSTLEAPGADVNGDIPSKKGISILCQLTGSAKSGVANQEEMYPWSAHFVLRVPVGANPVGADLYGVNTILGYLVGTLFETGSADMVARLDSLLHGALKPVDV